MWRAALLAGVAVGGVAALAVAGGSTLTDSVTALAHVDWPWLTVAVSAEAASMAAFARVQRRLLRIGGSPVHLGSIMAVTYAGNAISVSLPLAGSEVSTAFTFRQFSRHGIPAPVAAWALAVSGIVSSFAFAIVLAAGAIASGNGITTAVGLIAAVISVVPAAVVIAALRYRTLRRILNRVLDFLVSVSRRLFGRPGEGAEQALETFLDHVAALRIPPVQYVEVLALAIWNWLADCLCLVCAIRATGAQTPWQGLLLAYGAGMAAGSFGLTPGGLGLIEASLAAALVAAGLTSHHALTAVLLYRLISFWLVMMIGWAVMLVLRRRATV